LRAQARAGARRARLHGAQAEQDGCERWPRARVALPALADQRAQRARAAGGDARPAAQHAHHVDDLRARSGGRRMGQHERGQHEQAFLAVLLASLSCRQVPKTGQPCMQRSCVRGGTAGPDATCRLAAGLRAARLHGRGQLGPRQVARQTLLPAPAHSQRLCHGQPTRAHATQQGAISPGKQAAAACGEARARGPPGRTHSSIPNAYLRGPGTRHQAGARAARAPCGLRAGAQSSHTGCHTRGAHVHLLRLGVDGTPLSPGPHSTIRCGAHMSTFSVTCWPSKASGACARAALAACTAQQRRGTEACTNVQAIRQPHDACKHAPCGLKAPPGPMAHHVGRRARRAVHHRGQECPVLHLRDAKVCARAGGALSAAGAAGWAHGALPRIAAEGGSGKARGTARGAASRSAALQAPRAARARQGRGRAAAGRAPQTTARPAASSSTLLDLRSRCTMAGWCWCRKAMASATSAATFSSCPRARALVARQTDAVRHI